RVEVIWRSELHQGLVEEVIELTDELTDELMVKLAKKPAIDYLFKQNQVSKVELVEVPKLVADWIEKKKENGDDLLVALDKNWQGMEDSVRDWFDGEKERYELFARAWLDGYEVEKEPLYYVQLITIFLGYLNERNDGRRSLSDSVQNDIFKTQFTEAEIRSVWDGYMELAEEEIK
ncbi:DUF1642 domain-containing protein, partial [Listeria monocytogenes]